jgi:hypothetical protein
VREERCRQQQHRDHQRRKRLHPTVQRRLTPRRCGVSRAPRSTSLPPIACVTGGTVSA